MQLNDFRDDERQVAKHGPVESPERFGIVETRGGRLIAFREKSFEPGPGSRLINVGIYVLRREVIAGRCGALIKRALTNPCYLAGDLNEQVPAAKSGRTNDTPSS
jgi:NDP-sugar pyrophosphorylase family protein